MRKYIRTQNVRQLVISYPFFFPQKQKEGWRKGKESKTEIFVIIQSIFTLKYISKVLIIFLADLNQEIYKICKKKNCFKPPQQMLQHTPNVDL